MNTDDDRTMLILTLPVLLFLVGPGLLASLVPDVRGALLDLHILVADAVVVPIADGVGLDLPRVLLGAGVLGLVVIAAAVVIRRRAAARAAAGADS